jgi:4-aminobutyrate aminotransferase
LILDEIKTDKVQDIINRDKEVISPASRMPYYPFVIQSGKGVWMEDVNGKKYIDFLTSAAALNTGHCHPKVVDAIKKQVHQFLNYTSAYMYYENIVELAEELVRITPGSFAKKVAFGLTGSDANDGAIKLARIFTNRKKIIAFLRSYHGSTYGALSLSAISLNMRRKLGPYLPEIYHIPFPDCYRCPLGNHYPDCKLACLEYFKMLMQTMIPPEEIAAVIIEPIQGDAGIIIPPDPYLSALKQICEEKGILFIAEEVQTGFGRSGKWFAIDHWEVEPDIILLGKSIASGMPLSAMVARKEIMDSWEAPAHLFTMGGNPVSCAAALATIEIIEEEHLIEKAQEMGDYIVKRFKELQEKHKMIGDVRGRGLLIGVDLVKDRTTKTRAAKDTAKIIWRCWERGLILTFFSQSVLRIAPPLIIEKSEVDQAINIIEQSMTEVEKGLIPDEVLDKIQGW